MVTTIVPTTPDDVVPPLKEIMRGGGKKTDGEIKLEPFPEPQR